MEIDEKEHGDTNIDCKIKRQKAINKNLIVILLKLILRKKTFIFLKVSMKYLDTSNNRLKNSVSKKSTRLLALEFE